MDSVLAFTIIMLVWALSDFVAKKTKSALSSLLVASLLFLIGFKARLFPENLLIDSSLIDLGRVAIGFVIVHLGTMINPRELKQHWRPFVIGCGAVLGVSLTLFLVAPFFVDSNYIIAGIGAITGGTVSIVIVQEAAAQYGLVTVATFPVLVAAFQGLIGFPLTSFFLKKEAKLIQQRYRSGELKAEDIDEKEAQTVNGFQLPFMDSTPGTLFWVGVVVILSKIISSYLTLGLVHPFVIALFISLFLRAIGLFKPNILLGIDVFGLIMLSVLIIVFGPLASISIHQLGELIVPIVVVFIVGVGSNLLFSFGLGKMLGYSPSMSMAIGLTSLYGFPGTMILSQEAAQAVAESDEERQCIEANILPKMVIAGFTTVTIVSVLITAVAVKFIHP